MKDTPMYQNHPEKVKEGINTGWKIRATRELRKLTIQQLSNITGIEVNTIEAAENNIRIPTNSEFEKLAVALNTHPSFFAFPTWDNITFKSVVTTLEGNIYINGVHDSKLVIGYILSNGVLEISGQNKKTLRLYSFNAVASWHSCELHLKGENLAMYIDNYTHGSEFDADNRVVQELQIKISHYKNGIAYEISGLASAKHGYVSPSRRGNDWKFQINIIVKLDQIRGFYGIYPSAAEIMQESLSKLEKEIN